MKHDKIPALDHLRALAITLVLLYHYRLFAHPAWVDAWCGFGWVGVDLFFALSGYLIARQIFADKKRGSFSVKTFFIKRFFRILPAYWVVLALYFLLPGFSESDRFAPLWKYLSFTQNFGLDLRYHRAFSHAWSLCIEEQFYLLLPFTVLLLYYLRLRRAGLWLLLALFLSGFGFRMVSWEVLTDTANADNFGLHWYKYIYYPTYNRLDSLLAGVAVAGIFSFFPRVAGAIRRHANLILLFGVLLIAAAYFFCSDMLTFRATVFGYPLIALAFGCMVASAVCENSLLNKYSFFLTSRLATLSYSVYLLHKGINHMVQQYVESVGLPTEDNLTFFICMACAIAAALVLHYTVERPFLALRRRILAKGQMQVPRPTA